MIHYRSVFVLPLVHILDWLEERLEIRKFVVVSGFELRTGVCRGEF